MKSKLDINFSELNIIIPILISEVGAMSENNKPNSYPALFAVVAFAILGATVLLAIGGIYFSFINPSF